MICLGLDCAGRTAGVALMRENTLLYECTLNLGLTHSQTALCLVDGALRAAGLCAADVGLWAVCAGPGSFTGLRIGLAAVKGLAFAGDTPCAPVSTLEALAACHTGEATVVSALDARRGEVYWAAFSLPGPQRLTPDKAGKADELADFLKTCKKPVFFVGDGAELCYNKFGRLEGVVPCPPALGQSRAAGLCLAGLRMQQNGLAVPPAALLPQYLRLSQAERERAARAQAAQGTGVPQTELKQGPA